MISTSLKLRLLSWRDTAIGVCVYVSTLCILLFVLSIVALSGSNIWDEMHFADDSYRDAH